MVQVHVRPTTAGDAAALPAIERSAGEAFRSIPGLGWIADDDVLSEESHIGYARSSTSWVAVDEAERPIGFLAAQRIGEDLHIWAFAVRHDKQGRGTGRALVDAAIAHARLLCLTAVTLTTFRDVPWNEPFYAGMGFEALDRDRMGERLAGILRREVEYGLPGERRCAMRLGVARSAR